MLGAAFFVAGSAAIAYVSRASLRTPGSHGFYRFFAWECLLALFLLNAWRWFDHPFSAAQIISWLLLIVSLFLVIQAALMLRSRGRPDDERTDAPLVGIEKTTTLVTSGAYRFIRHPLYSSLLFLGWGIFFKHAWWAAGLLAAAATLLLIATARVEERENIRYFGPAYREYMKRTKMFVPFVF
jgi:protein-S-isoprenylcysteine O-methyltransferase Ste14